MSDMVAASYSSHVQLAVIVLSSFRQSPGALLVELYKRLVVCADVRLEALLHLDVHKTHLVGDTQ